ncbi:MAG: YciI family protein [Anaerolineales bacterium]|nr:YciI family protein [Anaerolineales bacterium]
MRFMMLMIPGGYEKAKAGTLPDPKAVAEMTKYNESLEKAGVLLSGEGLHPPSMGARIVFSGGKSKVVDGPFPEMKETLGGFWIIRVKSLEEAVAWALKCPAGEKDVIEIRQVQEEYEFNDAEKAESKVFEMEIKAR